jgi:hypothetical protein
MSDISANPHIFDKATTVEEAPTEDATEWVSK